MKPNENTQQIMRDLQLIPTRDTMDAIARSIAEKGRCDADRAVIWSEQLRYTYSETLEVEYPEYAFAAGDVLPVDTSVDPAAVEWEYFQIDQYGYADWIGDDGRVAPSSSMTAQRFTGHMDEIGHKWEVTVMDLERASYQKSPNVPIAAMKQENARRAHEAFTNWVWAFGDSGKDIVGLVNHPNIQVTLAAENAGQTSRLWANKTVDEILADVSTLINAVSETTLGKYFAAKVYMPRTLFNLIRDTRLGAGDGFASLLEMLKNRYSGDESGQGKVEFKILNECEAALRAHPRTGTDDSGIAGDFLLALPTVDKKKAAFVRARPFTQRPPQEIDMVMSHMTHSKIGGCKLQVPLAVHRMDFGTT